MEARGLPDRRKRVSNGRSRKGCQNCRRSRVKCDESVPACHQCMRSGRICTGYDLIVVPYFTTTPHEPPRSQLRTSISSKEPHAATLPIPQHIRPSLLPPSAEDCIALDFYINFLGPLLSSTFPCPIWLNTALRLGSNVSFVHSAVVGLSMTYRARMAAVNAEAQRQYFHQLALTKHLKALRQLRGYLDSLAIGNNSQDETAEAVILTCLLFMLCNIVEGDRVSATLHFRKGYEILDVRSQCAETPCLLELESMYEEVNGNFGHVPISCSPSSSSSSFPSSVFKNGCNVPRSFTSYAQASVYLDIIITQLLQARSDMCRLAKTRMSPVPEGLDRREREAYEQCMLYTSSAPDLFLNENRGDFQRELKIWTETFTRTFRGFDRSFADHIRLLCRYFTAQVYRSLLLGESTILAENALETEASTILDLAEQYMTRVSAEVLDEHAMEAESDVLITVWQIGTHCRDPAIRRRALRQLQNPGLGSQWQGHRFLACALEKSIHFEEAAAKVEQVGKRICRASDIPPAARLHAIRILVDRRDPTIAEMICARRAADGQIRVLRTPLRPNGLAASSTSCQSYEPSALDRISHLPLRSEAEVQSSKSE